MKSYIVCVKELHNSYVRVDADTEEDAVNRVKDGEGKEIYLEFSYSLPDDTWTVEEDES